MSNRELLELAAKAAGIAAVWSDGEGLACWNDAGYRYFWSPLADDGDALRLAVKCKIDVVQFSLLVRADVAGLPDVRELYNGDPLAATRKAIVRAAAEIGRHMP
jgi:hypothetical protein